jgi:hypothetical protein
MKLTMAFERAYTFTPCILFLKHSKEILIHMEGKVRTYTWDSELECITIWSLA